MGISLAFNGPRCQTLEHFFASSIWLLSWHFFRVLWPALPLLLQRHFPKHLSVALPTLVLTCNFFFFHPSTKLCMHLILKTIFKRFIWTVRRFINELDKFVKAQTSVSSKDSKRFIVSSLVILLTTGNAQCAACYTTVHEISFRVFVALGKQQNIAVPSQQHLLKSH